MIKRFLLWLLACCGCQPELSEPVQPASADLLQDSSTVQRYKVAPDFVPAVPGSEFVLGGQKFIVAPMTATTYEQHKDVLFETTSIPEMGLVAELTFCSLRRNYPDITRAQVLDLVDRSNFLLLWELLMDASGLMRQAGEMQRRMESAAMQHAA